ncbi:unnamed protein product [Hymenolepis diminuta]|uniref:MFS_1_like domain-containing protein n=1 Tax=Hymenolepis diminuta TaxID=6216 RepID=A0A0R3SE23_HYMDI|nr:unnamed protein product [Hymenolepis diminuta]
MVIHRTLEVTVESTPSSISVKSVSDDTDEKLGNAYGFAPHHKSFSFSCVYFNIFTVVGRCFRKHLGLANGLSVAGVSVGQMAFPSLVTHVLQNYGVRSGTLIMSAFSLHLCVTAALMPRYVVEAESTDQDLAISSSSLSRRTGEPSSSALPSPIGGSSSDIDEKEIDAMLRQKGVFSEYLIGFSKAMPKSESVMRDYHL